MDKNTTPSKPAHTEKTEERDHLGQTKNPAIELEKKTIEETGKRPAPEKDWRNPESSDEAKKKA